MKDKIIEKKYLKSCFIVGYIIQDTTKYFKTIFTFLKIGSYKN